MMKQATRRTRSAGGSRNAAKRASGKAEVRPDEVKKAVIVPLPQRSRRSALHHDVVTALRQMIVEGRLKPGARVPEQQFCRSFGVSRTPLREALKILASEGLVELRPNRGSVVAPIYVDRIASVFEMMGALEELTGTLICARISNEEIEGLEQLHARMHAAHRSGDRAGYFELNQKIHCALVTAAKNVVLTATYTNFARKIQRARFQANYDRPRWDESLREHDAFMVALRRRDSDTLSRLLRQHSDRTGEAVLAHLREWQRETSS